MRLIPVLFLALACKGSSPSSSGDRDGDGVADRDDLFPDDPAEWADRDGDGVGDNGDAFPDDPTEQRDSDGDGVGDRRDCAPDDPTAQVLTSLWWDQDGDGYTYGGVVQICTDGTAPPGMSTTQRGDDCDDLDPTVHAAHVVYTDADEDGWTVGEAQLICTDGPPPAGYAAERSHPEDCDDTDPQAWEEQVGLVDGDGDGKTVGTPVTLCTDGTLPAGYADHASTYEDCDDTDPTVWLFLVGYPDQDGDGRSWSLGEDLCTPGFLPPSYSATPTAQTDCDDTDPDNWLSCGLCQDTDGDGWFSNCDGYTTRAGPDCDDADADNWQSCGSCEDADGDGWFEGCDAFEEHPGPDCDDADGFTYPGAVELPDDGADQDCDGNDLRAADGVGIYVDPQAPCPGSGTMDAPFCTLQDALPYGGPIFVTGDALFPGFVTAQDVAIHGGYIGGWLDGTGYVPSSWAPGAPPTVLMPFIGDPFTVESTGSSFVLTGFTLVGSGPPTGDGFTLRLFVDTAVLHDVRLAGGTAAGTYSALEIEAERALLREIAVSDIQGNAGSHGIRVDADGLLVHGSIFGGIAGPAGTTVGLETAADRTFLLVGNRIDGGLGGLESIAVRALGPLVAVGNVLHGGTATARSTGLLATGPHGPTLINNGIHGGSGPTSSVAVDSIASPGATSTTLVNNLLQPGMGSSASNLRSSGPVRLLHNLFEGSGSVAVEVEEGGAWVPVLDPAQLDDCGFVYCIEGGGNLLADTLDLLDTSYHLGPASPAVDAGMDPAPYVPLGQSYATRDRDGDPRPADGDNDGLARYDIGPDERLP